MKKFLSLVLAIMIMVLPVVCLAAETYLVDTPVAPFTVDLTDVLVAIVVVISGIICRYITPLMRDKYIKILVKTAYYAAEQLYDTGIIEDKLQYAEEWLQDHGVKVDTRALIEAFVGEVNQSRKDLEDEYYLASCYDTIREDGDEDDEEGWEEVPTGSQETPIQ